MGEDTRKEERDAKRALAFCSLRRSCVWSRLCPVCIDRRKEGYWIPIDDLS